MRFGSVCSGIEAASVAWHPLGWRAAWVAEIEAFPSAVLAHHYPDVPNLGDMTTLPESIVMGHVEAPDVFCGGTPCQAFSVAGLRKSLDDARGNLSLTFCEIANAIDISRAHDNLDPCIVFWENVPGVLNTKDNAFGCFLAGLAGEDDALVPPGGRWSDAGCVLGPQRAVAWRILDAQHFGLAQRRRRVFVVASAREGFDPAAVLFEFEGVRRDSPPSREARQGTAHATAPCLTSSGRGVERTGDTRGQDPVVAVVGAMSSSGGTERKHGHGWGQQDWEQGYCVPVAYGGNNQAGPIDVATARNGCASASGRMDFESETFLVQPVAHSPRGFDASEGGTPLDTDGHSVAVVAAQRAMQVRRLTPVECERLQGFPDNYTAIPWRGKPASECPDGPRYKALGNSWAVPCVRWIGWRIAAQVYGELA
jgi:DNA (cytosine-5)-methyltransferase 1